MSYLMSCAHIPEYEVYAGSSSPSGIITSTMYIFSRGGSLTVLARKLPLSIGDRVWGGSLESSVGVVLPPPIPPTPLLPHKCCNKLIDIIDDNVVYVVDSAPKIVVRGVVIPDPEMVNLVPVKDRFSIVLMGETISFCPFCGSKIYFEEERGEE